MTEFWRQRPSRTAPWSHRTGAFSFVLLIVAGTGHRFEFVGTIPFLWLMAIIAGLALLALLLAAVAAVRIWTRGQSGAAAAVAGCILAAVTLIPFGVSGVRAITHPALNDISTDPENPPRLSVAARKRKPQMNPVGHIDDEEARTQTEAYPGITGRRYDYARERVAEQVDAVIADRGWTTTARHGARDGDAAAVTEAVARSFLLGFKSDVAIRIEGDADETRVDMRSASRYGDRDLGDNAKRVNGFLSELDQRMAAGAGL